MAQKVRMFVLFKRLARINISLEILDLEDGITINASPGCQAKFLMRVYLLSLLQEGVHLNKQTNADRLAFYWQK